MIYEFTHPTDGPFERVMTVAEYEAATEERDGESGLVVEGVFCPRHYGQASVSATWSKPLVSDAAAIHPKDVPAAMEQDRRCGVPTDYTGDGRPILRSRAHRSKYLARRGLVDLDGGYGD